MRLTYQQNQVYLPYLVLKITQTGIITLQFGIKKYEIINIFRHRTKKKIANCKIQGIRYHDNVLVLVKTSHFVNFLTQLIKGSMLPYFTIFFHNILQCTFYLELLKAYTVRRFKDRYLKTFEVKCLANQTVSNLNLFCEVFVFQLLRHQKLFE